VPTIPLPGRFRPLFIISLIYLGVSFLLRLTLWKIFGPAANISLAAIIPILTRGMLNDCVALIVLNVPAVLYLTFMPDQMARSWGHRLWFALVVFFTLFGIITLAIVEFVFFHAFGGRFNHTAVAYMVHPYKMVTVLRGCSPLIWIMLVAGLLAALILFKVWPQMDRAFARAAGCRIRMAFFVVYLLLLLPALLIPANSFDTSSNSAMNEITHNGLSSLGHACHTELQSDDTSNRALEHARAVGLTTKRHTTEDVIHHQAKPVSSAPLPERKTSRAPR